MCCTTLKKSKFERKYLPTYLQPFVAKEPRKRKKKPSSSFDRSKVPMSAVKQSSQNTKLELNNLKIPKCIKAVKSAGLNAWLKNKQTN